MCPWWVFVHTAHSMIDTSTPPPTRIEALKRSIIVYITLTLSPLHPFLSSAVLRLRPWSCPGPIPLPPRSSSSSRLPFLALRASTYPPATSRCNSLSPQPLSSLSMFTPESCFLCLCLRAKHSFVYSCTPDCPPSVSLRRSCCVFASFSGTRPVFSLTGLANGGCTRVEGEIYSRIPGTVAIRRFRGPSLSFSR